MNNKEFICELSDQSGYTREDTLRLAKSLVEAMMADFERGEAVAIAGFGSFEVKKRM